MAHARVLVLDDEEGVFDFLAKPLDDETLARSLAAALAPARPVPEPRPGPRAANCR